MHYYNGRAIFDEHNVAPVKETPLAGGALKQAPVVLDASTSRDASVVIKWFRQGEVLAEQAVALRDAYLYGPIEVVPPSLSVYELANVLSYKADLTNRQVQTAMGSLFDMGLA